MFKIIENSLPDNIDPVWLKGLQEKAAARRKAEAMVREILGENTGPSKGFFQILEEHPFPDIDVDLSVFDRHADRGDSDVSG
jgi:hypothetical protein